MQDLAHDQYQQHQFCWKSGWAFSNQLRSQGLGSRMLKCLIKTAWKQISTVTVFDSIGEKTVAFPAMSGNSGAEWVIPRNDWQVTMGESYYTGLVSQDSLWPEITSKTIAKPSINPQPNHQMSLYYHLISKNNSSKFFQHSTTSSNAQTLKISSSLLVICWDCWVLSAIPTWSHSQQTRPRWSRKTLQQRRPSVICQAAPQGVNRKLPPQVVPTKSSHF